MFCLDLNNYEIFGTAGGPAKCLDNERERLFRHLELFRNEVNHWGIHGGFGMGDSPDRQ
jgi:hypothetical protein